MTRGEVKELQRKHNGEILRHPVTREAWGVIIKSKELIPELDKYADKTTDEELPCAVKRVNVANEEYHYTIVCPSTWFDVWGWADE